MTNPPTDRKKKGPWCESEDDRLRNLVARYGASQWTLIAEGIDTRTAKQCRERWHQNLNPKICHHPITPEEAEKIERWVSERGPKWAEFARDLGNRSDNAIKNWYNGGVTRRQRKERLRRSQQAQTMAEKSPTSAIFPMSQSQSGSQRCPCASLYCSHAATRSQGQYPAAPQCSSSAAQSESPSHQPSSLGVARPADTRQESQPRQHLTIDTSPSLRPTYPASAITTPPLYDNGTPSPATSCNSHVHRRQPSPLYAPNPQIQANVSPNSFTPPPHPLHQDLSLLTAQIDYSLPGCLPPPPVPLPISLPQLYRVPRQELAPILPPFLWYAQEAREPARKVSPTRLLKDPPPLSSSALQERNGSRGTGVDMAWLDKSARRDLSPTKGGLEGQRIETKMSLQHILV
jgi:hypothetical protein